MSYLLVSWVSYRLAAAIGPHRCDVHVRCHLKSIQSTQNQPGIARTTLKTVEGLTLNDGQVARRVIAGHETL
jgi:hypothetical protein